MQDRISQDSNNVVSIFSARQAQKNSPKTDLSEPEKALMPEESAEKIEAEEIQDVMRRNQENYERMRKERSKANQSVLRSYRIKN